MEWAKHRALRPVTCPPYQDGRIIRVEGSTDNHEVYAALEDLKIMCEEQLRGCNDVLAQMNDKRHKLDLYHIDWHVAPRGFEPISIQFEFDRERMFEILSDEIYNGDPYVFLRELLQNSVDAIRMRRGVFQSKGFELKNLGTIHVDVKHGDNGDAVITWRDDGVGMDEYIIRNYLSVAGKSYYRSSDFERLGLKMDPISKFGIGILSCFVAAERIEIETYKDPYLHPRGEKLRIIIPAINRQFRIESLPQESADVGTTVKVFVEGKKIPTDENKNVKPLDITAYLSIVAGFVEFPIVITEGDRKTIILHPKQDAKAANQRFGNEFKVHQLDLSYPWSEVFLPQDLPTAREVLREEHWDIGSDFNLEGYDGVLTCLVPADSSIDLKGDVSHIRILDKGENIPKNMRTNYGWESYFRSKTDGMSQSSMHSKAYAIYRDGILLSEASSPRFRLHGNRPFESDSLPIPRIVVNIPKTKSLKVDLARSRILGQSETWDVPICQAYQNHILKTLLKSLLELDPAERLYHLGRLMAFYNIEPELILEIFPPEKLPLVFLETEGLLSVVEWQEITGDMLYDIPIQISGEYDIFENELEEMGISKWLTHKKYNGFLVQWKGKGCIVLDLGWNKGISIQKIGILQRSLVKKFYRSGAIQFLNPPWDGNPPLLQNILFRKEVSEKGSEIEPVLEKTKKNPALLNPEERELLINELYGFVRIPKFIEFPQPFEQFFAYGPMMLNIKHPVTQALLRFAASLKLSKIHGTLPKDRIGHLQDALNEFLGELRYVSDERKTSESLNKLWLLSREAQSFDIGEIDELVISSIDFVPGTYGLIDYQDFKKRLDDSSLPFGKPL